jgi:hypothetical protein
VRQIAFQQIDVFRRQTKTKKGFGDISFFCNRYNLKNENKTKAKGHSLEKSLRQTISSK